MKLYDNIKELRLKHNLSQSELANLVGYSNRTTIAKIEAGKIDIPQSKIASFAKALQVDPVELMGLSPANNLCEMSSKQNIDLNPANKSVRIPILGYVVAGVPISAVQDILGYEEISKDLSLTGEFFALRIKGDSMEPTFTEGDIIIVRQQPDVESNEIAVVLVNGDEGTVKRIKKDDHGIVLIGDNALAFSPKFYSNDEIASLPIKIVGKVVELRRSF